MNKVYNGICKSPIYSLIKPTPLQKITVMGNNVWLKREDMHPINSFKLRGAYHKIHKLIDNYSPLDSYLHLLACSAGNHAQGVALSAKELGIESTIVMPKNASKSKINAVSKYDSKLILYGDDFEESYRYTKNELLYGERIFIHPFDDYDVISGQGTVGKEIVDEISNYGIKLNRVYCPIGGGGLLAGVGTYISKESPFTNIIGVESSNSNALSKSLINNKRIVLKDVNPFVDATAVRKTGKIPFDICRIINPVIITVSNKEVYQAIQYIFNVTGIIVETAGALAMAGCIQQIESDKIFGENIAVIVSGKVS